MNDYERRETLKQLSDESVTDDELHQLLTLLAEEDGDHPFATLGAISEATGRSVESLAHQLARLREGNDFELLDRINALEQVVEDHEERLQLRHDEYREDEVSFRDYIREERRKKNAAQFAKIMLFFIGLVVILVIQMLADSAR